MKASVDLRNGILCYAFGIMLIGWLPGLPSVSLLGLALLFGVFFFILSFVRGHFFVLLSGGLLGLSVGGFYGHSVQSHWLPHHLESQDLAVTGKVVGLPTKSGPLVRFNFEVDKKDNEAQPGLGLLRLSWYDSPGLSLELSPGQCWRLTVKVRHPRGNSSPGAFDLEAWAAREGIQATGYVKSGELMSTRCHDLFTRLDRVREQIKQWISQHVKPGISVLLTALLIGDKSGITPEQWQLFNSTGTTHLMVISGLHIGLVAALGYWIAFGLGWLGLVPLRKVPRPRLAALASLFAAFFYASLAGFTIPVQRALVMTSVALAGPLLGIRPRASNLWVLALAVVLSIDPLAVTSLGFWYSFFAVAALLFALSGRRGNTSMVRKTLAPQWVVFIVLCPMLLYNQQTISAFSPLVNLIAIPVVGGLAVPLSLLSVLLQWFYEPIGVFFLQLAAWLLDYWLIGLQWLHGVSFLLPVVASPSVLGIVLAVTGGFFLLTPRALGIRRLAPFLLLPWLFPRIELAKEGQVQVTVLDVGQGLSVLARTREHALLYDTGGVLSGGATMAERVVIPYLKRQGVSQLDRLMISHGDSDHAGGLDKVVKSVPVSEVYSGTPLDHYQGGVSTCKAGLDWKWDGVEFEVLSGGQSRGASNDRSCVLKITASGQSFLLTGDIGQRVEQQLIDERLPLRSTVLLVPHHGSKYSSSENFLDQVGASIALVSAGYRNRFGHPAEQVLERLEKVGAKVLSTAELGTLWFVLGEVPLSVMGHRQQWPRYWWR